MRRTGQKQEQRRKKLNRDTNPTEPGLLAGGVSIGASDEHYHETIPSAAKEARPPPHECSPGKV